MLLGHGHHRLAQEVYRAQWLLPGSGGSSSRVRENLARSLITDAVPASVPVIAFLVLSRILDHSGQTLVLADGIAAVSPPLVYASIASVIGALGAFMTSSSTASNVLFGGLQSDVAHLHGLPVESIIAAQAAGSAYGNAIGPANVVLGTSITGIKGQEGAVLRQAQALDHPCFAVLTGIGNCRNLRSCSIEVNRQWTSLLQKLRR